MTRFLTALFLVTAALAATACAKSTDKPADAAKAPETKVEEPAAEPEAAPSADHEAGPAQDTEQEPDDEAEAE